MNILLLIASAVFGYSFSHFGSNPKSKIQSKLPTIAIRFIQVSPNLKISVGNRIIHIHHWIYYTVILIFTLTYNVSFFESLFAKGYLTGAIINGLTYPDWKTIVKKKVL